jgi:hypothetical protein
MRKRAPPRRYATKCAPLRPRRMRVDDEFQSQQGFNPTTMSRRPEECGRCIRARKSPRSLNKECDRGLEWTRLAAGKRRSQMGPTGVEPARPCGHKALNLARLPIPPRARIRTPDGWPRPAEARSVSLPGRLWASRTGAARKARAGPETPYFSGPLLEDRELRRRRCRHPPADRSSWRPWPLPPQSGAPARASWPRSWRAPYAAPRTSR